MSAATALRRGDHRCRCWGRSGRHRRSAVAVTVAVLHQLRLRRLHDRLRRCRHHRHRLLMAATVAIAVAVLHQLRLRRLHDWLRRCRHHRHRLLMAATVTIAITALDHLRLRRRHDRRSLLMTATVSVAVLNHLGRCHHGRRLLLVAAAMPIAVAVELRRGGSGKGRRRAHGAATSVAIAVNRSCHDLRHAGRSAVESGAAVRGHHLRCLRLRECRCRDRCLAGRTCLLCHLAACLGRIRDDCSVIGAIGSIE